MKPRIALALLAAFGATASLCAAYAFSTIAQTGVQAGMSYSINNTMSIGADPSFALAAIEDVSSKPNYAAMVERYGKDLVGTWDGKWLFRYGNPPGMVIILK